MKSQWTWPSRLLLAKQGGVLGMNPSSLSGSIAVSLHNWELVCKGQELGKKSNLYVNGWMQNDFASCPLTLCVGEGYF